MDVFSFAIILWEVIVMEIPFHGFPVQGLPMQVTAKGLRPEMSPAMPKAVAELLNKCWHHEPEKRPNFKEILKQLRACKIDKTSVLVFV